MNVLTSLNSLYTEANLTYATESRSFRWLITISPIFVLEISLSSALKISPSIDQLVTVILLTVQVFLDHDQRNCFYILIGGKSLSTGVTHPSASYGIGLLHWSRIYHSCIILITVWTSHIFPLSHSFVYDFSFSVA